MTCTQFFYIRKSWVWICMAIQFTSSFLERKQFE